MNKTAVVLTYDITNKESFEKLRLWLNEIDQLSEPKIENRILIGNKLDLSD